MNSDQYVEEIEHTRDEIDRTLYTLEDKLSPRELFEQAIKWSGGAKEFSIYLGRILRDNPIPATLMGISLIWLLAAANSRRYDGYGKHDVDISEDRVRIRSGSTGTEIHSSVPGHASSKAL